MKLIYLKNIVYNDKNNAFDFWWVDLKFQTESCNTEIRNRKFSLKERDPYKIWRYFCMPETVHAWLLGKVFVDMCLM